LSAAAPLAAGYAGDFGLNSFASAPLSSGCGSMAAF